jgi:ABC-type phosphate transport system substrate-binding protein
MKRKLLLACVAPVLLAGASQAPASPPESTPIAVVVGLTHVYVLRKSELELVYRRKKLFWDEGSRIQPVNLPATTSLRRDFSQAVLGASPEDLEKYWNDMYFHGISPPFVLSTEEAVLRFVSQTPGAIGYVSYCSVDMRVKVMFVITAQGRLSDDLTTVKCAR